MKKAGEFKNLVVVKPIIIMSYELRANIMAFVNGTNASECQWFHTIERTITQKGDKAIYKLDNMLIPEQEVTGATVESPGKGQLALYNELKVAYRKEVTNAEGEVTDVPDMECINNILSHMHAWCHSHVNMQASPSGTDETTFREWIEGNNNQGITSPVIMMIVNKREEVYIKLYDPEIGIYCENPDLEVIMPSVNTDYVTEAIKSKVKSKSFQYSGNHSWTGAGYRGGIPATEPRVLTGPSSRTEELGAGKQIALSEVHTLVRAGRGLLSAGIDSTFDHFLTTIALTSKNERETEQVLAAVMKSLGDQSELYVLSELLRGDLEPVRKLVKESKTLMPKVEILQAEIYALLSESWAEHPDVFYAVAACAARIPGITGKPIRREAQLELWLGELANVVASYEERKPALVQAQKEKTL